MPPPIAEASIENNGRKFPLYVFEGISHVIAENMEPDEKLIPALLARFSEIPAALGVMFYDAERRFMRPLVWVRASGTTVAESSCGSGTAAFGAWALRDRHDGTEKIELAQPGGVIAVEVEKSESRIRRLSIGGQVSLGKPFFVRC